MAKDKLIYASAARKAILDADPKLAYCIDSIPGVDAVPVVHGRWCRDGDWLVCLNCESEINVKNSLGVDNRKNYCPNCGASMKDGDGNV